MPLKTVTPAEPGADEFTGFYTAHFGRIATQLHAYLGDRFEAQDVTQEAFCRAYDRWSRIGDYERPEAWVRQVAWNLATNRLRHLRVAMRHLARQREEQVEGTTPDRVALVRELAKLPPKHRLAIVSHHIGGLSTSEIAAQEGVAEGTVRSWLTRGRAALADQLTEAPMPWDTPPAIDQTFSLVRRRRAIRRASLAAVVVVLVALPVAIVLRGNGSEPPFIGPSSPPASPSPAARALVSCTAKTLPGLPGAAAPTLMGGEPTGRYHVGLSYDGSSGYRPLLWTDGVPSTFDLLANSLTGIAVNSRGVVAVSTTDGLWTYRERRLEPVLEMPGLVSKPRTVIRINTRGDILLSGEGDGPPAIVLAGGDPVPRELPLPDGATTITARDLGEDGTIVGYADAEASPVVWAPDLNVRRLPIVTQFATAEASRIRGDWVLGVEHPGTTPTVWNLRTGFFMRMPDLDSATAITSSGWVLARAAGKSVISMGGQVFPLPGTPSFESPVGTVISDDGHVIGGNSSVTRNTEQIAVGWTCS